MEGVQHSVTGQPWWYMGWWGTDPDFRERPGSGAHAALGFSRRRLSRLCPSVLFNPGQGSRPLPEHHHLL